MKFLLDGMLGKLTRWLRMIGCEAEYLNDQTDRDLLSRAKRESLTLLTSDEELYRTAASRGIDCYLVKGRTEAHRLASLAERFKLNLYIDTSVSRCPVCGSPIREAAKNDVEGSVPPTTFKVYHSFWVCTNSDCAKVYWQGSHWKRIEQTLEAARKILESNESIRARPEGTIISKPGRGHTPRSPRPGSHQQIP